MEKQPSRKGASQRAIFYNAADESKRRFVAVSRTRASGKLGFASCAHIVIHRATVRADGEIEVVCNGKTGVRQFGDHTPYTDSILDCYGIGVYAHDGLPQYDHRRNAHICARCNKKVREAGN